MEYKIDKNDAEVTVAFSGGITFSENVSFRQVLKELSESEITRCTFDLSKVDMVDSAGLGMFLIAKEQADTAGWTLTVTGAHGYVASMLKLTKLSEVLAG